MAVQTDQPRIWQWGFPDTSAAAERVLDLAEELVTSSVLESPTVTLGSSPAGVVIKNEPLAEARSHWQAHGQFEAFSANIQGQVNGVAVSVGLNLSQHLASVNVPPQASSGAEAILDVVRRFFPRVDGPAESELTAKGARLDVLLEKAEAAETAAQTAQQAAQQAETQAREASGHAESAAEASDASETQLGSIHTRDGEAADLLAKIQTASSQAQASRDAAKEANDEVGPLREAIKAFADDVQAQKHEITRIKTEAETTRAASKGIVDRHEELQGKIDEALLKAVGAGLFGAFERRRFQLVASKWIWAGIAIALAGVQIWIVVWVSGYLEDSLAANSVDWTAFVLRASASLPTLGMLIYAIRQYAKERDFEEVYAFKSSLSISLKPYLDLVEGLPGMNAEAHQEFTTHTIGQVFEYPVVQRERRGSRRAWRRDLHEFTELVKAIRPD